ncbi:uncharacterized protein M6B38_288255 [Iris pallida]|uniref:Uncharacterized protein n=1 Tax=Iris pallida TaxID=29817 RepID=A0AAX6HV40_IRIPA|nr:uncharacterized protein M6B38_288255 [Iris pallida]
MVTSTQPISPDIKDESSSNGCIDTKSLNSDSIQDHCHIDEEFRDSNASFILEQSKSSRRKLRFKKDSHPGQASKRYDDTVHHDESDCKLVSASRLMNGGPRLLRERVVKNVRNCNSKFSEKFHCSNTRFRDRYDLQSCSCSPNGDYRIKDSGYNLSNIKSGREMKSMTKSEPAGDMDRPLYRGSKYSQGCFIPQNCALPKGKVTTGTPTRDAIHRKQVWEPMNARRKGNRSSCDPDCTMRSVDVAEQTIEDNKAASGCSSEIPGDVCKPDTMSNNESHEDDRRISCSGFVPVTKSECYLKDGEESCFPTINKCGDPVPSSSSSDNCSSCLSEGDSSISSSSAQNTESSSTSDSEDASPQSEGRVDTSSTYKTNVGSSFTRPSTEFSMSSCIAHVPREERGNTFHNFENGGYEFDMFPPKHILPIQGQNVHHMPVFPPSTVGYHNQSPVSWPATPASGLMQFPQTGHFVFPPSTLGYSLPAACPSEFGMQYNSRQAATPPLFNAHHHSAYQAGNRVYPPNPKEQSRCSRVDEPRMLSLKPPSSGHNGSVGNASRSRDDESSSFSLFHFGGPIAVAAGLNASSVSQKEGSTGRMVSSSSASAAQVDTSSKEKMAVEEYSLFSAGNAAMFSFF